MKASCAGGDWSQAKESKLPEQSENRGRCWIREDLSRMRLKKKLLLGAERRRDVGSRSGAETEDVRMFLQASNSKSAGEFKRKKFFVGEKNPSRTWQPGRF